jgi:hypothetical protein
MNTQWGGRVFPSPETTEFISIKLGTGDLQQRILPEWI